MARSRQRTKKSQRRSQRRSQRQYRYRYPRSTVASRTYRSASFLKALQVRENDLNVLLEKAMQERKNDLDLLLSSPMSPIQTASGVIGVMIDYCRDGEYVRPNQLQNLIEMLDYMRADDTWYKALPKIKPVGKFEYAALWQQTINELQKPAHLTEKEFYLRKAHLNGYWVASGEKYSTDALSILSNTDNVGWYIVHLSYKVANRFVIPLSEREDITCDVVDANQQRVATLQLQGLLESRDDFHPDLNLRFVSKMHLHSREGFVEPLTFTLSSGGEAGSTT